MSLSKIEALKNSHRRSAIKQEIIPKIEPIIRPTRDKSIQNRTTSLNIKQSTGNDIFAYERRVQQLERELQQYQFQHQANLVYNKQFKSLGKIFGDENLQFEEIRQKIQDIILNTNQRGNREENRKNVNLRRSDDKSLTQFFTYTKQELKDKLVQAERSQFLSILQLGSSILLENETSEQRKRKSIREMFYQIWRQILLNSQQSASRFYNLQQQSKHLETNENESRRIEQNTRYYYESQILEKNKYIAQLAEQLQKVTNLFSQKSSKTNYYKDNYQLLESECQSLSQQNTQLFQQTISLKREIMALQDRVREHEDRELQKITLFKDSTRQLQMLKQQIREVKLNKEKQSRDLINKIDELMLSVNRYDSTISELEGQKNQMLRQIWVHKANLQQISNQMKKLQKENLKYKEQNQVLQQQIKNNKDRYLKLDNDTEGRVHELNDQIMNIRQQFDHKEREYKNKIQLLLSNKQNLQIEIEMLVKQYKTLEENNEMRDHMDSQPHTAVFGTGNKLSEEMRTSLIDDRVVELQQLLKKIQENSEKQKNQLLFQFHQQKSSTESKEKRLKQLQTFLQNTKNMIKKTQDEKTMLKQLSEVLKSEKFEIERLMNEGKQKIMRLQQQLSEMSIQMERMKGEIIKLQNSSMKKNNIEQKVINYERIIRQLQNKHEDYVKIQDRYKLQLMNVREVYQNKLILLQKSLEIERQESQKNKQNITILNKTLLQKQRDHAQKYSSLNNYIAQKNNQINGLNNTIQKLSATLNIQLNKSIRIDEQSREFEASKQQNEFFKAEIQRNEKELNKIIKQINILLSTVANLQRLLKQLESKYYQEMGKDSTQIKLLSERGIGSAKAIIESSENLIHQLNSKPHQNVEELKQAYKNLSLLASQLENIIKNKEEQQLKKINQIKLNSSREKQWSQQLIVYQNKLNEYQFTISKKDQHIGEMTKALEIQSQKIQKLVRQHAQMQQNYNPILSQCNELQKNHEALTIKLKDGQIQISQLRSLNKALQQQSSNLKQLNQTLRSQNSMFRQTNDQLRSQISHLTSNNGILEEQKNNLLNTVHSMNQQLVRLSNQKLELSAFLGIGSGHSDQSSGNGHKKIISKYYVNNNGTQNKNQLHTIKQVINSQNQLQEQHANHNYQQSNNLPFKMVAEQNLNISNGQELKAREIDLRQNQAFKQEQNKNQYGQFRNRPGVPKNSVKYEALLKQSFDLESNQVNRTQNNPTSNENQMNKNLSGSSGSQNALSISNRSLPNKNGSISNIQGQSDHKSVKKQEENGSPRSKTFIESINKINGQASYNLNKTEKECEKNIEGNQIISHSMQSFSPVHDQIERKKKTNNNQLSESFDEEQSRDIVNNINITQNRLSETRISHKQQKHRQSINEVLKQKSEENVSIKIQNDGQAELLSSLQSLSQKYLAQIKQLQSISPINQQESIHQKQQLKKLQQSYQTSQKQIQMICQNNLRKSDQQIVSLERIQNKNPSQTLISDTNLRNRQNTEKIISQEIEKIQQPIIDSLTSNVHNNSHIQIQTIDNRSEIERSNTHRSTAYFGNNSHITAKFNSQFHANVQETHLISPNPNINQSNSITGSNKVISFEKGSQSEVKNTGLQQQKIIPHQQTNRIYGSFSNGNIGYQSITNQRDIQKQYSSQLPQGYTQISTKPTPHNVIYTQRKIVSENIINSSRQMYSQRDINTVTNYNNRLQVYGETPKIIRVSANSPRGQAGNIGNQHASSIRSAAQEISQPADNKGIIDSEKKKQQSDKQLVSSMSRAIFESGTNLPIRLYQSTSNNQQTSSLQSITGIETQQRQQLNKMTNSYSVKSLQNQSINSINLPNQSINQIQKSQKQIQNKIVNGLEDSSKSVASQKHQNIEEDHPPPIKQPIQIKLNPPTQQIIQNTVPISNKAIQSIGIKYGSNVQAAESVNTMREITSVQSETAKEVSLNKNIQQLNKNIQSIKSIEQARISINPPPISIRTQQQIPAKINNNIYTTISSPRILINQNQSFRPLSSSFQNRYPSPSKVAFAEKIDKIQRHQVVHKIVSVSPNIVVHNYNRQSHKIDEPYNKLITIKSQPNLLMNQRSLSPPQTMTQKLIYHQPISPNNLIANSQRSISPPQQNNYNSSSSISMNQRMVDTFNPINNKNIYTVKHSTQPIIPRPQSTLSPIKIISQSTKNLQNSSNKINEGFYPHTHTKGDNSMEKQQNMFSLNASQATQNRRVQLNPSINSIIPVPTFNSISVKTEQPPHQNYQSSSNQGHQMSSNNVIFSSKGIEMTGRLVSSRDGSILQGNNKQTFEVKPLSPKILTSPPSQIYGFQAPKSIKFNQASSKNKEMGEQVNNKYRFSSRPVTQTTHIHNLYSDNGNGNGFEIQRNSQYRSAKQLSQEQVFSSKHKIVEGFSESSSSGIDVQQKDAFGNCCPNC